MLELLGLPPAGLGPRRPDRRHDRDLALGDAGAVRRLGRLLHLHPDPLPRIGASQGRLRGRQEPYIDLSRGGGRRLRGGHPARGSPSRPGPCVSTRSHPKTARRSSTSSQSSSNGTPCILAPTVVSGRRGSLITSTNAIGLDRSDPSGADDIHRINELNLPVDIPVIVYLSTMDVIHSFGITSMRVKQDAIPGMEIPVWWEPTVEGAYEVNCSQLCGLGHYRMRGFLTIMNQADYQAFLAEAGAQLPRIGFRA